MATNGWYNRLYTVIIGGSGESDWFYVGDQDPSCLIANASVPPPNCSKNVLNPNLQQKIVKQFSVCTSMMATSAVASLPKLPPGAV